MELRKDPITQSWVILGQREAFGAASEECPLEPERIEKLRSILTWPAEGAWQVRVLPHPHPLYHVEGEPGRLAEGIYDKMGAIGAHEVVVETPLHDKRMSQFSDEEIERVLWVWASRIADLKKDARFKYVSVFKNQGALAGEEWAHAHSQLTATIFVPRRIKYELSSAHEWFKDKERCIFCDTVRQEEKRSEEHTSELQSPCNLVCRLLLEKKTAYRRTIRATCTCAFPLCFTFWNCVTPFQRRRCRTIRSRRPGALNPGSRTARASEPSYSS